MQRLIMVHLLPAGLVNVGNLFGYLFQLIIARYLTVSDVGTFNTTFALINFLSAPAAVLPFGIARAIIVTESIEGATGRIILKSAAYVVVVSAVILLAGGLVIGGLHQALGIGEVLRECLALSGWCAALLSALSIGWFQGQRRYVAASIAIAAVPAFRLFFGYLLVLLTQASVNAALIAIILPGALVFAASFWFSRKLVRLRNPNPLPQSVSRDFSRFMLTSTASSLLLLGLWNLDVVTVRALFSAETSGLYAIAAALGRIPYLFSVVVANTLFSEAVQPEDGTGAPRQTGRSVLLPNLLLSGALGGLIAIPFGLFAEPLLTAFGGPIFATAAPMLRALCIAMVLLALLQIVATYMLARGRTSVFWILAATLAAFLALSFLFAGSPVDVVHCLTGSIAVALIVSLGFLFSR